MRINLNKIFKKIPSLTFGRLLGLMSHDIGIDLGTANTLVFVSGKGIAIREPSVVARHKKTKEILAIGTSAKRMLGRTPSLIETIKPLKGGVIADFDAAAAMLTYYIKRVHETGDSINKIPRPKVVIGIPSGVTEVERRAVADVSVSSGAREAHLVEEPMAAAIGAGAQVLEPEGIFIVDIGGGTSEIAVISLGGIVLGRSIRVAGDEMNEAIINFVKLKYSVLLGEPTSEEIKMAIGSCTDQQKEEYFTARGRDLESGLPKTLKLSSSEIREALTPIIQEIVRNVKDTLEETPPELISDIYKTGIILTGGGSLIRGIDQLISESTEINAMVADDPLTCVVRGCGKLLEDEGLLKKIRVTQSL
jgi:rod shape-determining protein MreB and related proteins